MPGKGKGDAGVVRWKSPTKAQIPDEEVMISHSQGEAMAKRAKSTDPHSLWVHGRGII